MVNVGKYTVRPMDPLGMDLIPMSIFSQEDLDAHFRVEGAETLNNHFFVAKVVTLCYNHFAKKEASCQRL